MVQLPRPPTRRNTGRRLSPRSRRRALPSCRAPRRCGRPRILVRGTEVGRGPSRVRSRGPLLPPSWGLTRVFCFLERGGRRNISCWSERARERAREKKKRKEKKNPKKKTHTHLSACSPRAAPTPPRPPRRPSPPPAPPSPPAASPPAASAAPRCGARARARPRAR